mmetsp:Transcript_33942/g.116800  ORF Transcript_33942/g.116800 Transcript_33942/m.116800 type:complete len:111 (-) Transcript_33942:107-439(-)
MDAPASFAVRRSLGPGSTLRQSGTTFASTQFSPTAHFSPPMRSAPPAEPLLPHGWSRRWDRRKQRYYYVDHETRTTSWYHPLEDSQTPQTRRASDQAPFEDLFSPYATCG